ncbi:MAG: hypothetical protein M5U26_25050 [Planctomycetota bacterium]|nr:hypothetical protein [Planctomycetota bacterium]
MSPRPFAVWGVVALALLLAGSAERGGAEERREPLRVPVGYEQPGTDRGGPQLQGGLDWTRQVWPRTIRFAERLSGGAPAVLFLTNFSAKDSIHELKRRMPLDAVEVAPESAHYFPGREAFEAALRSRPRFDVFFVCRMSPASIPEDVQYEILKRVKDDGAGLVLYDVFDRSETLNPEFLRLKPRADNPEMLAGVPYAGLREWKLTKETPLRTLNYWNLHYNLRSEPQAAPLKYKELKEAPFGKGRVLWGLSTGDWQRQHHARTLLPNIHQARDMWVETDYLYSYLAKLVLRAAGRTPVIALKAIGPQGPHEGALAPSVEVANGTGEAFRGRLRWQVRDTWGETIAQGEQALELAAATGSSAPLMAAKLEHAGRQFLDVWVLDEKGVTQDWGSGFFELGFGLAAPEIAPKHPQGTPRGEPLAGTVKVAAAPPGSRLRLELVDRLWRTAARSEHALGGEPVAYAFSTEGLEGAIWTLRADVLDARGKLLARGSRTLTSPWTVATRGAFHPLMTGQADATPEGAARMEFLRRLGFLSSRSYSGGDPLEAEALAWEDVQIFPFPRNVTAASNEFASDRLTDWEEPTVRAEFEQTMTFLTQELRPFGLRGYNFTDDSAPETALPLGAYTTLGFHEWLKAKYGSFEALEKGWGWKPVAAATPEGELPYDPYVVRDFHAWLLKKHGSLEQLCKDWKLKPQGFGTLHTFAAVQREMLLALKAQNPEPWAEAQEFMKQYREPRNPWGAIHAASVKAALDAGRPAPWIDAQYYLAGRWVARMGWARDAARKLDPELRIGSDASFYMSALAETFGALDYLAPYYNDRAVKLAVARGRMRRAGDFGACLGAYGAKPANMSGRREQIWNTLFAGGTGFYYWMLTGGVGIGEDLRLSDAHALYQCEVLEELSGGTSELFAGAERIFHPVALVDSRSSHLCDELEKSGAPLTTHDNSLDAFQSALEDLGLNPYTLLSEELTGEWLAKLGVKLLVLPGTNSLSDAEVQAVARFVAEGGTVLADVRPAARRENGRPRAENPLDAVFGLSFQAGGKEARVRGALTAHLEPLPGELAFGEAFADPRVQPSGAAAAGSLGAAAAFLRHRHGQGQAFLFNVSFSIYSAQRLEGGEAWAAWRQALLPVLDAAGLRPEFESTSQGRATPGFELSPFRNGSGYLLGAQELACGDFAGESRPLEVKLPASLHQYDLRAGKYLGEGDVLKDAVPRSGHRAYALLPYKVKNLKAEFDAKKAAPGATATLTVDLERDGAGARAPHVIRVEAFGPDGYRFWPGCRVLRMPEGGALKIPFTLALNDPAGAYSFVVTDVATGRQEKAKLKLEEAGR